MTDTLTSGAVVVVRSPKGNWTQAFGKREKGGDIALQTDDHFRVGSVTKTWTGTVILQLIDEGRFKLSDPISAYLTGVPNGDNITIEHLLSMRSGLFNYSTDQAFNQSLDDDPTQTFSIDALLQIAFKYDPYFTPGTDYRYSNTNTLLLGQLIEKITTISVAEAFQQRLFTPLGLSKTFFPPIGQHRPPCALCPRLSVWHQRRDYRYQRAIARQAGRRQSRQPATKRHHRLDNVLGLNGRHGHCVSQRAGRVCQKNGRRHLPKPEHSTTKAGQLYPDFNQSGRRQLLPGACEIRQLLWPYRRSPRLQHLHGARPRHPHHHRRMDLAISRAGRSRARHRNCQNDYRSSA